VIVTDCGGGAAMLLLQCADSRAEFHENFSKLFKILNVKTHLDKTYCFYKQNVFFPSERNVGNKP
jgi:hypothetical protein